MWDQWYLTLNRYSQKTGKRKERLEWKSRRYFQETHVLNFLSKGFLVDGFSGLYIASELKYNVIFNYGRYSVVCFRYVENINKLIPLLHNLPVLKLSMVTSHFIMDSAWSWNLIFKYLVEKLKK